MIGIGVQQDKDWCLSITLQQPLPNRHNINLFAFPYESCFFTICKDKQAITPSRRRSFQNAGNLPFASAFIGHIPCHLYQPHYTIPSLKHKITHTSASIVRKLIRRQLCPIQLHENRILQILTIITALRQKYRTSQTIVYTIILIERLLLSHQRTVVLGNTDKQKYVTNIIHP